jgi:hypothetical protein
MCPNLILPAYLPTCLEALQRDVEFCLEQLDCI